MASIATTIANAIYKVSTEETYANMEFATTEEARANFTAALLFELGLGPKPAAAHAPVTEPKEEAPKKKRAAKKAQETVVAEAAVAVLEQVKEPAPEVEALAEELGQLALNEQPKPKKARKTKAAEPVKTDGEPVVATKKKPGPKPKAKPEGPVNVEKLTPTHKKHLKAAAEELKVAIDEKAFLAYVNAMSAEAWAAKSLEDHIRAFAGPAPTEFLHVEFNGKDYLIDPKTRFIYEPTEGNVTTKLGEVGTVPFEDMEMPEEETE